MENIFLKRFLDADVDNFTSDFGIKARRVLNPALRKLLPLFMKRKLVKEVNHPFPDIDKSKPHIYVAAHSFTEDTMASIASIEQNAYILFGTTDQLIHNPQVYAAWLNGFIYVNRKDPKARKMAVEKMARVLNSGTSILMFAEGVLNNTENLLCNEVYSSAFTLANIPVDDDLTMAYAVSDVTGYEVVPLAPFHDLGSKEVHVKFSNKPINLSSMAEREKMVEPRVRDEAKEDRKRCLESLRNELATLTYYNMEEYASTVSRKDVDSSLKESILNIKKMSYSGLRDKLKRLILSNKKSDDSEYKDYLNTLDIHELYMEYRRLEYRTTLWTEDVWDEELLTRKDKDKVTFMDVYSCLDDIELNKDNQVIVGPLLQRKLELERYDFKKYMKENWNK